jgi:hypothetical protein
MEKCPNVKDLCKSKIDWNEFRKRIFDTIKEKVEESRKKDYSLNTTGWILISDVEFSDSRFEELIEELKDNGWGVNIADGGVYKHMLSVSWEFVH